MTFSRQDKKFQTFQRSLKLVEQENPFQAKSFFHSVGFALEGLGYAFQTQRNLRIDAMVALSVIGLGLFFQVHSIEWIALTMAIFMVVVAELLNTAIESLVDLFTQGQYNIHAKRAKDVAASACLLMACCAACVGMIVFVPYLIKFLF